MRYADSLLTEGEQIVLRTRQHWLALLIRGRSAVFLWLIALALLAFVWWSGRQSGDLVREVPSWLALILLLLGVVIFVYRWWQWSNQDYVITNRRLLKVTGILSKHAADSSLEKINDAILDQPVLGRMLDYGDLTILTAAEEAVDLYHMLKNPKEFKKVMLTQKHNLETEFMYVGAMPPTPPLRAGAPPAYAPPAPAAEQVAPPPPPVAPVAPPPLIPSDPAPAASEAAAAVVTAQTPPSDADASLQVTQTLARLADLRDSGAITPAEYEAKKQELLGRL